MRSQISHVQKYIQKHTHTYTRTHTVWLPVFGLFQCTPKQNKSKAHDLLEVPCLSVRKVGVLSRCRRRWSYRTRSFFCASNCDILCIQCVEIDDVRIFSTEFGKRQQQKNKNMFIMCTYIAFSDNQKMRSFTIEFSI